MIVAPRSGAWIEIHPDRYMIRYSLSLPVRERGLKYFTQIVCSSNCTRRSPFGSVD